MSELLLELRGVDAGYGRLAVVRSLDLVVHAGEVVALMGPNGAGKTTTILTIAGFLEPLGGEIALFGSTPTRKARAQRLVQRGLGVVPDDRGLFPKLTVRQHLRLAGQRNVDASDAALDHLPELRRLLDTRVGILSGGEQQMVALARALARRPRLLLIDEMSLGLAPLIAERLALVLRRLATETGTGVLLVEQHARLALEVSDRVVMLEHGDVRFDGTADDLRSHPDLVADLYLGTAPLPCRPALPRRSDRMNVPNSHQQEDGTMKNRRRCVAAATGLLLLVSACGSDDDDSTAESTSAAAVTTTAAPPGTEAPVATDAPATTDAPASTDAPATSTDEPAGPATGEPLRVGFVSTLQGTVTYPGSESGAQAAAEYANTELGGVNGRPIELVVCGVDLTPQTMEECGQQLANDDSVDLVLTGILSGGGAPFYSALDAAGKVVLGGIAVSDADYAAPDNVTFYFGGGVVSGMGSGALAAHTMDSLETVSVLFMDSAGGRTVLAQFEQGLGEGVEVNAVPVAPDAADVTPQVASAISSNPDALGILTTAALCPKIAAALDTVSPDTPVFTTGQCVNPIVAAAAPIDGWYMATYSKPVMLGEGAADDLDLFLETYPTIAAGADVNQTFAAEAWGLVLTAVEVLNGTDDPESPESIQTAIRAFTGPVNLGPPEIACPGPTGFESVCGLGAALAYQMEGDHLVDVTDGQGSPTPARLDPVPLARTGERHCPPQPATEWRRSCLATSMTSRHTATTIRRGPPILSTCGKHSATANRSRERSRTTATT